jgi:hypothetical protein
MKVLKTKEWMLETQCRGCESVLGVEKDDVKAVEVDGTYSDSTHYSFECPVCLTSNDLEGELLSKVPSGIRELAVQKSRTRRRGR